MAEEADGVVDVQQVLSVLRWLPVLLDQQLLDHEAQRVGDLKVYRCFKRNTVLRTCRDNPRVDQQDLQMTNLLG